MNCTTHMSWIHAFINSEIWLKFKSSKLKMNDIDGFLNITFSFYFAIRWYSFNCVIEGSRKKSFPVEWFQITIAVVMQVDCSDLWENML